jgi:hypothetical protein
MLFMGQSGSGKSTSCVPLGISGYLNNPGYELRVLDFDGKFEEVVRSTLARLLKEGVITKEQHDTSLIENYDICLCTEEQSVVSAREGKRTVKKLGINTATAWNTAVRQLEKWSPTFSDKTILIVDSFTHAVRAITNFCQELNSKLNQSLEWRDYSAPQHLAESLMFAASDFPCHTIITGHADPVEVNKPTTQVNDKGEVVDELVDVVMCPISVGKSGRVKLPTKMNHLLVAASEGKGTVSRRYVFTEPRVGVMTKTPYYGMCESKYPIDTALVEYFKLRG